MKITFGLIALCASVFCTTQSNAETRIGLGGAAIGGQSPYIGEHRYVFPVPYFSYETDRFRIAPPDGLEVFLIDYENDNGFFAKTDFLLGPEMPPRFNDDALYDGLDRPWALNAGVKARIGWEFLYADGEMKHDISNQYNGYELTAALGVQWRFGPVSVRGRGGVKHRDENYNLHLYGVAQDESTVLRPSYLPGSTTTPFANISLFTPVSQKVVLIGNITYEDLDALSQSPLLEDDPYKLDFALGLAYSF